MRKKTASLNFQFNEKLQGLLRIGESRHNAKREYQEYCNLNNIKYINGQAYGIFSWNTYNSYKQTLKEFTLWIKSNYPDIKLITDIDSTICSKYLIYRMNNNISAWTIDKDKSALNKVFNYGLTKRDIGLPVRSKKNIIRSRKNVKMDKHFNCKNYTNQILIANASGCRRESILKLKKDDFIYNNGELICVYLKEKGGKERYAIILKEYRDILSSYLKGLKDDSGAIFDRYTTMIDNHSFRSDYANKLLNQFITKGVDDIERFYLEYRFK